MTSDASANWQICNRELLDIHNVSGFAKLNTDGTSKIDPLHNYQNSGYQSRLRHAMAKHDFNEQGRTVTQLFGPAGDANVSQETVHWIQRWLVTQ